ncbi:hypothetical protein OL235_06220 [Vagococcus intermedius]|nr:hypothetical protein [Vagococcus intermedius]WEG74668.1 hypothetical protein OL235_06220 [Vagococcus intermedius]
MLKIKNLQVKYKDFTALNIHGEINIKENEIIGIIGANGAGNQH